MLRIIASALVVTMSAGLAMAQPGQTPQAPYPPPQPYPQPPPQPAYPGVPPPYQYQPVQLTSEDQEMLDHGEISDGEHLGGGLAALFLGFGSGQAIQGRWGDRGWLFTFGEIGAIALMIYGATRTFDCIDHEGSCRSDSGTGEIIVGALGFSGLRIWETIDAFAVPPEYNSRVRRLKARLGYRSQGVYGLYLAPPQMRDPGGVAGVSLRF